MNKLLKVSVLNLALIVLSITMVISGCANSSAYYKPYYQIVVLDSKYKLDLWNGDLITIDSTNESITYGVDFKESGGGASYLAGFKIREYNANKHKRLKVIDKDSTVKLELSINDFKDIYRDTINLNRYFK